VKLQIRQRDRRALLLLALGVFVYAIAEIVVLPVYDRMNAARELAADKENQLRRYRRAQLRKGQYADLLKIAADRIAKGESVVISAPIFPLESAELQ